MMPEVTRRILQQQDGPTVLVGHSYGGAVISEAGTHPAVSALVYIDAPDKGESVQHADSRPATRRTGATDPAAQDGFLFLDRDKFPASFAGDLPLGEADSWPTRRCRGSRCARGRGPRVGRSKPGWYLVATDDGMIPPPAQRAMAERAGATVTEAPGSHSIYLSQPQTVADLIRQAAGGVAS